jgi:cytochrome c-type biogenesis protein CcmH
VREMIVFKQISVFFGLFILALSALAGIDTYEFDKPEDVQRYNQFIEELRCPKCQNNNLAGSNAPLAKDLRRELHRLIIEGKTDRNIIDFMVDRYGDFVLYRPPLQKNTYILWYGPIVMLILGFGVIALIVYRRSKTPNSNGGLTDGEQEQLETFLTRTHSGSPEVLSTPPHSKISDFKSAGSKNSDSKNSNSKNSNKK